MKGENNLVTNIDVDSYNRSDEFPQMEQYGNARFLGNCVHYHWLKGISSDPEITVEAANGSHRSSPTNRVRTTSGSVPLWEHRQFMDKDTFIAYYKKNPRE